jgi:hypothetical protein
VLARLPQQPVHQRIKRALAALRWIERTPLSLVHGHSVLPTPADWVWLRSPTAGIRKPSHLRK